MYIKRLNRASPEQIFIVAQNNQAVTLSTGAPVVFDYQTGSSTGNGYYVKYPWATAASGNANPGMFAGLVAGADIVPGAYGSVQCWGHSDYVLVTGYSTSVNVTTGGKTAWDNASLQTRILRPLGLVGNTDGAATNTGYMGIWQLATNVNATTDSLALNLAAVFPGGYIVPTDVLYSAGSTSSGTFGTVTFTSSAWTKGFIRALC